MILVMTVVVGVVMVQSCFIFFVFFLFPTTLLPATPLAYPS